MLTAAQLATAIERLGARLGERARARLYVDPFWLLRYGERGVRHSREDGDFHVKYLCQALREGDVTLLERYATWLRTLLVSRGMCSRHLADNFIYLGDELRAELPSAEAALAASYLESAARCLDYTDGPAGALSARADEVVERVARELQPPSAQLSREIAAATSYLGDALAADEPEILGAYFELLRSSRKFALAERIEEFAEVLARSVIVELEEPASSSVVSFIGRARQRRGLA